MGDLDYIVERRAALLADKIEHRIEVLARMLREPGQRPAFTTALPPKQAIAWWRAHRDDAAGQRMMEQMTPQQIMALDRMLSEQIEAENLAPVVGNSRQL